MENPLARLPVTLRGATPEDLRYILDIVESCEVDLDAKTAKVTWTEGSDADTDALVKALLATDKFEGSVSSVK